MMYSPNYGKISVDQMIPGLTASNKWRKYETSTIRIIGRDPVQALTAPPLPGSVSVADGSVCRGFDMSKLTPLQLAKKQAAAIPCRKNKKLAVKTLIKHLKNLIRCA